MKMVCHNERMLQVACSDMFDKLSEYGELAVEYGKPYKDKTLKQTGFFFGALVDSVIEFFKAQGIVYSVDEVKNNFYQAISPKKTITQFNGKQYIIPKHISEMSREEMSEFIDKAIWLCDNARAFHGLILHPSIRYTFIRHITIDELRAINERQFPRTCPEYLEYQRKQACLVCGIMNQSEAHHLKEAGYSGVARKADDWLSIPLCAQHHREYHIRGKEWFKSQTEWIEKHLTLYDFCKVNFNKYLMKGL